MANDPREVVYNGYTITPIAGSSFSYSKRAEFSFTCDVLVQGASNSAAAFETALTEARGKLGAANKACTIDYDGVEHLSLDPAAFTAIRPRGEIVSQKILNRAAILRWTYSCTLPAQDFRGDTAQGGFVDGQVSLALTQAMRPVYSFTGEYRAEPGVSPADARALLGDGSVGITQRITDWLNANAALPSSGTKSARYKITTLNDQADWTGSSSYPGAVLSFSYTARYSLIFTNAAQDALAANYTVEDLTISGNRVQRWSLANKDQPYQFTVSATVVVDSTLDDYDDLQAVYIQEVKEFLEAHLNVTVGDESQGGVAGVVSSGGGREGSFWWLIAEKYTPNTTNNTIQVSWVCQRADANSWISVGASMTFDEDLREVYIHRASGLDDDYDIMTPGRRLRAIQRWTGSYVSTGSLTRADIDNLVPELGGGWRLERRVIPNVVPNRITTFSGEEGWLYDITVERPYTFVRQGDSATAISGGSTGVVPTG
ncbi:MAG: hypothetical protein ACPGVG_06120 [Mycobacterium sp.]